MKERIDDKLDGLLQIELSEGGSHAGGVRPDGTVVMWGLNNLGQLGDGSYATAINPVTVGGLSNSMLRLGGGVISSDTSSKSIDKIPGIVVLAENEKLQIDKLKITKSSAFNLISTSDPVNVGSLEFKSMDTSIATVSGGVITPNNEKRYGSTKVIIRDKESGWQTMIVVKVKPAGTVANPKIAIGSNHTIALKADGTVWTWGLNNYGQLGNGTKVNSAAPVKVEGLEGVIDVAAGDAGSVALLSDGTIKCWGHNADGRIGDGTNVEKLAPKDSVVKADKKKLENIIAVFSGMGAVFAIDKDGKLWSWGNNDYYRLGIGEGGNVNVATPVAGGESGTAQLEDIIDVESCNASTIALKANGTVFIWGYAAESGLGNSVHSGASSSPVQAVKGEGPSPISNKFIETIMETVQIGRASCRERV